MVTDRNIENKSKYEVQAWLSLQFKNLWSYLWEIPKKVLGGLAAYWRKQPQAEPQSQMKKQEEMQESCSTEKTGKTGTGANAGVNTTQQAIDWRCISVKIFGDIIPDECPQTLDSAQKMVQKLPQLIQKNKGGKGTQLAYTMKPLSTTTFTSVDETRINEVVLLFDHITQLRQQVHDKNDELKNYSHLIKSSDLEKADRLATDFENQDSTKAEIRKLLLNIRSEKEKIRRV